MARLVVEHKTTSSDITPGSTYWRKLTLDTQVSQYLGATEGVEGMLYDVIRKPGIKPFKATPAESRKYTKAGTLYAAQRERDETPEEFSVRLRADISEGPNKYYARGIIVRLPSERTEAARDTWLVAGSIRESMRLDAWPRNPGSCDAYGRTCDYWAVCAGETTIEDATRFRTAETPHEELPGIVHRLPLLSNSAMSAYRACPRKYLYSYVQRRRPIVTPHALTFGTLIHAGLEVWWSSVDLGATLAAVQGAPDPFDVVRAEELLRGYHARWSEEEIRVLAVEKPFVAPLINPETGAASRTFELAGKCDAIAEVNP
ncbi:MAG: PD-(D/E)XK nuclease family protein [Myxococcales bacterium]|nr:PD-(D/E)XK nuclease family protein [Myxococcales bacterium]